MFAVGFIPSRSNKGKPWLTDIDPFLCPMEKVTIIAGKEYLEDERGFSHLLAPFKAIDNDPIFPDTVDCRSKVFESRNKAVDHINSVMRTFRRPPKWVIDFTFDDGVILE